MRCAQTILWIAQLPHSEHSVLCFWWMVNSCLAFTSAWDVHSVVWRKGHSVLELCLEIKTIIWRISHHTFLWSWWCMRFYIHSHLGAAQFNQWGRSVPILVFLNRANIYDFPVWPQKWKSKQIANVRFNSILKHLVSNKTLSIQQANQSNYYSTITAKTIICITN